MAFERQAWSEAHTQLSAADQGDPLDGADLERLAIAAHLIGRSAESMELRERAHQQFLAAGEARRAARCAAWLAVQLLLRGEMARASGWMARSQRLLEDGAPDSVEQGYLLLPIGLRSFVQGDYAAASEAFTRAAGVGERFGDGDLTALGRQGQGRALIRAGEPTRGLTLLDEVMVSVTAGEVSPTVIGDVYCSVIDACHEIFDLRRAQEWTEALRQWCESQSDRVPYRGSCLVHRSEIMQLHGAWRDAMEEARRARDWLAQPPTHRSVGTAFYQLAELHRLRGESAKAEEAYRQASHWGREPQPGLALLRLAQGQVELARTAIYRAVDETRDQRMRSRLLGPLVEIALAVGDIDRARAAAAALATIAAEVEAPLLRALSCQANGSVLLAEGEPQAALAELRRAWTGWCDLDAPYEAARARVLLGLACRALGDHDSARLELDAARRAFRQLGAAADLARVNALTRRETPEPGAGLTGREVQVLVLVATGKTNRAIAEELAISEKTVARHLSNIFSKLGLSSRAAATAYAYRHDLVAPART